LELIGGDAQRLAYLLLAAGWHGLNVQYRHIGYVAAAGHTAPARLVSPVYVGSWLIGIVSRRVGRLPMMAGLSSR
jgi:hypothetical protein